MSNPSRTRTTIGMALLTAFAIVAAPSAAHAQSWTNWTSGSGSTMDGTLFGQAVNWTGTTSGGQFSSGSTWGGCCTGSPVGGNYFNPSAAYTQNGLTAPGLGFIQLISSGRGTITFATAVVNPYLAFISTGQPGSAVTFSFGDSFTVLSNNNTSCAYWGCGSYSTSSNDLTGNEFSGTIQFQGTFNSLSFSFDPGENWHGLTVGADSVVPEPATMTLIATGLVGMAAARRKKRRK